jgi:hypothetical protein
MIRGARLVVGATLIGLVMASGGAAIGATDSAPRPSLQTAGNSLSAEASWRPLQRNRAGAGFGWSSCTRPILVQVDTRQLPSGTVKLLRAAFAEVHKTTGLDFVWQVGSHKLVGTYNSGEVWPNLDQFREEFIRPYRLPRPRITVFKQLYSLDGDPLWGAPGIDNEAYYDVATREGERAGITYGHLQIAPADFRAAMRRHVNGHTAAYPWVLHGLGMILGLHELRHQGEIMSHRGFIQYAHYQAGDRAGLRQVSSICWRPTVDHRTPEVAERLEIRPGWTGTFSLAAPSPGVGQTLELSQFDLPVGAKLHITIHGLADCSTANAMERLPWPLPDYLGGDSIGWDKVLFNCPDPATLAADVVVPQSPSVELLGFDWRVDPQFDQSLAADPASGLSIDMTVT